MTVAVIIPVYNAEPFIKAAIHSLVSERNHVQLDIIAIEDGSTDGTPDILARCQNEVPELRVLHNPRKGIAAARNTGLEALGADCSFVAFLDADDLSVNGRIARQMSLLKADPTIDAIYGKVEMFNHTDLATMGPLKNKPTRVIRGPYLQSAMFRRNVFERVGRFDESYRQGCDTDFVLRLADAGVNLSLDDGIAAYYRRHNTNVTLDRAEMHREFVRATMKSAIRNRIKGKPQLSAVFDALFMNRAHIQDE
jgi:glycosyltransferase involved in cell wall biosynthesis